MTRVNVPAALAEVRQQIAERETERAAMLAMQRSRAEALAALDAMLDSIEANAAQAAALVAARWAAGEAMPPLTVNGTTTIGRAPGLAAFTIDLAPLLVTVLGKSAVRAALLPAFAALPEGVSSAQRRQRVAELVAELEPLYRREEALIRASEKTDTPIDRRAEAPAYIVLAP